MIIKKKYRMISGFTAKPRAAKIIRTKYSNITENTFSVKPFSFNHTLTSSAAWKINLLISCRVILFHSSWRAFHNCSVVFGFLALERSPRVFHTFSIGLRSELCRGQSITVTFSALRKFMTYYHSLVTWDIVLHEYGRLLSWISQYRQDMIFYKLFINSCIYLSL